MTPAVTPRATELPPAWAAMPEAEQARIVRDLREALTIIPACPRTDWIKVGHYLKGSLPKEVARELWSDWSRTSPKFNEGDLE